MKKLSLKKPVVINHWLYSGLLQLRFLSDLTGDVNEGELVTIAARSGQGKSTLARNLIHNFNYMGEKVLLVSTEETEYEIGTKLKKINERFHENDLYLENEIFTIEQIEKDIKKSKVHLVVIDYVQQLEGNIRQNTKALKQLAVKYNCVIFILSQLNRGAANRLPDVSMLSKSDNILHDSDQVWLMMMTEIKSEEGNTLVLVDVAKNRKGSTGKVWICLDKKKGKFFDLDPKCYENANEALANELSKKHPSWVDAILDQLSDTYKPKKDDDKPTMVLKNGIIV